MAENMVEATEQYQLCLKVTK
uniref:Uncharacterized protein n=1 Tax=Anguilla anguilla TaxID=7936 RepID=A0A0E9W130_ANGAN